MQDEEVRRGKSPLHEDWDPVNHPAYPGPGVLEQSLIHQKEIADYVGNSIWEVISDRFGGSVYVSPNDVGDARRANTAVNKKKITIKNPDDKANIGSLNMKMNASDTYDYNRLDQEMAGSI